MANKENKEGRIHRGDTDFELENISLLLMENDMISFWKIVSY